MCPDDVMLMVLLRKHESSPGILINKLNDIRVDVPKV